MSGINGQVLEWARTKAGLSREEVATAFKKQISDIEAWEIGESVPTYPQLEKLAYQLYKRPIALFFLPELPNEPEQSQEFRTLPEFVLEELSSDTRYAIREARAMQISLEELSGGLNLSERRIFADLDPGIDTSPAVLAREVRNYIRISLQTQFSWSDNDEALKNWRHAVQESGIFIFKRSFKQLSISGFSLLHDAFPVIYLNNSNAFSRQIFTIFHELAHIHHANLTDKKGFDTSWPKWNFEEHPEDVAYFVQKVYFDKLFFLQSGFPLKDNNPENTIRLSLLKEYGFISKREYHMMKYLYRKI